MGVLDILELDPVGGTGGHGLFEVLHDEGLLIGAARQLGEGFVGEILNVALQLLTKREAVWEEQSEPGAHRVISPSCELHYVVYSVSSDVGSIIEDVDRGEDLVLGGEADSGEDDVFINHNIETRPGPNSKVTTRAVLDRGGVDHVEEFDGDVSGVNLGPVGGKIKDDLVTKDGAGHRELLGSEEDFDPSTAVIDVLDQFWVGRGEVDGDERVLRDGGGQFKEERVLSLRGLVISVGQH